MSDRVQAIERSIDILSALADGPKTVTQVAHATKLSKPTAFRLLGSLGHRSMVVKDEQTNLWMLGPGWLRMLAGAAEAFQSVGILAREPMEQLTAATGDTSVIHCRVGFDRVCLAQVASANAVRYTITVGAVAPLHIGSSGRILLAFGSEATPDGLDVDRDELDAQLRDARVCGYAVSIGELTPGAAGVSVPVHGRDRLVVALSVIGPVDRFTQEHVEECVERLREAAGALEARLLGPDREIV